jgi:hypothetical protein
LIKSQSLIRNYFFILGLVCLIGFISSGFIIYFLTSTPGLLFLFSPVFFIFVPIPFGVVFAELAYLLRQIPKEKNRSMRFTAVKLGISMILIIVTYVFFMALLGYYGSLMTI